MRAGDRFVLLQGLPVRGAVARDARWALALPPRQSLSSYRRSRGRGFRGFGGSRDAGSASGASATRAVLAAPVRGGAE
eukprot:5739-Chlamydomonas_euryale.AAC.3